VARQNVWLFVLFNFFYFVLILIGAKMGYSQVKESHSKTHKKEIHISHEIWIFSFYRYTGYKNNFLIFHKLSAHLHHKLLLTLCWSSKHRWHFNHYNLVTTKAN
jgi:hypothetical protein